MKKLYITIKKKKKVTNSTGRQTKYKRSAHAIFSNRIC